jgi:SAM-dependent methyltransferase
VFELIGGDASKLQAVCGDFVPLLLDDGSIDVVIMSSAFHHAEDPHGLLGELRRVLAPAGAVALLNETPWHPLAMLGSPRRCSAPPWATCSAAKSDIPGHLGSDYVLYGASLGDRAYTMRTWRRMAARADFSVEVIDTGIPSYPPHTRGRGRLERNLVHLLFRHS